MGKLDSPRDRDQSILQVARDPRAIEERPLVHWFPTCSSNRIYTGLLDLT